MSEFSKNFRVSNTYEKRIVQEPFKVTEKFTEHCLVRNATRYEIEAGVYQSVWVDDLLKHDSPGALDYVIDSTKRRLIEHMFGEFRKPIHEIRRALFDRDIGRAEKLLTQIERQMFE